MSKELKFTHITKCAGTFIEHLGNKNGINWGRFHSEYGWQHEILNNINPKVKEKYDCLLL